MPDSRLIAGNCYDSPYPIEVFSKEQLQIAITIRLRVTQGPLPTRI